MAINRNKFKGTGVALVTPFQSNGKIDLKSLSRLVEHIIKGRCEYLVVLGTTGESVTLDKEEKAAVVKHVIETANKRVPVVLGMGGNNTGELLSSLEKQDFKGIDAILSVSPYYSKPSQRGIYQHYKAIAEASPVPVILYNVPGRTASNMLPETTIQLASDFKNIIGIKEASGNIEQCMKIIKNRPKDFLVISGDDALTLPIVACGGDGVISVVANAFPKGFSEMTRLAMQGDVAAARKHHYKLTDIIEQLFADGNPGGIKAALSILKVCPDHVRLPLVNVNDSVRQKLEQLIKAYK